MRYSLNQLQFERHRITRNAVVHFEPAQRSFIPQRNAGGPKSIKAKSRGAFGSCKKVVCLVIGQGNDRHEIRYLKIDRPAQSVQHSGKRCAHRNQSRMPFSPCRRVCFVPENRRPNKARFGDDLGQGRHSDIQSPQRRSTVNHRTANNCRLSALRHSFKIGVLAWRQQPL